MLQANQPRSSCLNWIWCLLPGTHCSDESKAAPFALTRRQTPRNHCLDMIGWSLSVCTVKQAYNNPSAKAFWSTNPTPTGQQSPHASWCWSKAATMAWSDGKSSSEKVGARRGGSLSFSVSINKTKRRFMLGLCSSRIQLSSQAFTAPFVYGVLLSKHKTLRPPQPFKNAAERFH